MSVWRQVIAFLVPNQVWILRNRFELNRVWLLPLEDKIFVCLLLKDALAIATYHWCTYLEWFHLHICQVGWLCLWEVRLTNWNRLIDLTHRIAQKYLDSWLAPTSLTQELVSLHLVLILACHSFALLSVELILARQRLYPLVTHL